MKKNVFTFALALLVAASAWAYDFKSGDLYYNITDEAAKTVEVTYEDRSFSNYSSLPGVVTIPETVSYNSTTYSVTSIGYSAFYDCSALTQVTIPNSVTSIGNEAFFKCSALTQVTIPNSVTSIGNEAFYGCSALTQVTIPNSVESIGDNAFASCDALTQVSIGDGVTSIGNWAFSGCSALAEITVLATVPPTITANTFSNINPQVKVSIPESSRDAYMADENWKQLLDLSEGQASGTCGDNLTWTFTTADSTLTISGTGNMYDYSYYFMTQPWSNCYRYIKKISLQNGLTGIGGSAFSNCSALTQITIPEIVTSIGDYAFYNCSALTQVNIPESVTSIGSNAFYNCSALTQVNIPESVTSIGSNAFEGCSQLSVYKNLSMAVATKNSSDKYFTLSYLTALDTLVCPAEELNVITDQELLLCSKQVKSIEVHSGTVTAAGFAYIKRQQNTLAILDMGTTENTELDNLALYDCYALEKLTLPAGLERIGYKAVAECVGLQAIDIPAGVTEIDDRAFENCRSISSISFGQESGQKSTRSTASSLKRIGNWAFYNCHQLQELAIPEGVTEIGNAAFYGCTYLENLELPASVQAIGDNCFALCSKLQAITVQATTPPTIAAKTFYDVSRDIPVYVPADALEDYQNDTYWQEFNLHAMPTGLQTPSMPESIRVYGGTLHNPQQLPVSLYDMQGRMVYSGKQQSAVLNSRKPKALIPPEMETFPAVFVSSSLACFFSIGHAGLRAGTLRGGCGGWQWRGGGAIPRTRQPRIPVRSPE